MKSKHLSILGILLITLSIGACNKTPSNSNVSSGDTSVSSFESTHNVSSDNPGGGTPKRKYGKYTIKDEVEDISDLQGSPWLNTSIEGIMNKIEQPSIKDDFFANVNYDYLSQYTLPQGTKVHGGKLYESSDLVDQRKVNMHFDDNDPRLNTLFLRIFEGDFDAISAGLTSIMNMSHENLLNAFSNDYLFKGLHKLATIYRYPGDQYPLIDIQFLSSYLTLPYLAYLNLYGQQKDFYGAIDGMQLFMTNGLILYPRRDYFDDLKAAIASSVNVSWQPTLYEVKGLPKLYTNLLDLTSTLKSLGFKDDDYIYCTDGILAFLNEFCSSVLHDPDKLRGYLLDTYTLNNMYFLGATTLYSWIEDPECADYAPFIFESMKKEGMGFQDLAYAIIEELFPEIVNRTYIDKYVTASSKTRVTNIVEDVISTYSEMLNNCDWISSQTKQRAVQKINEMTYTVFYNDEELEADPIEFENLENLSIMDAYSQYQTYFMDGIIAGAFTNSEIFQQFRPYTVNAVYQNTNNSFYICHGIFSSFIDEPNLTTEELYGSVGFVIGHEISHAFDNTGSQYWQGKYLNWWTDEDRTTFNTKVENLINYINTNVRTLKDATIHGENLAGEVIADMGSMRVLLKMIESKDASFDMDKFFKEYARWWSVIYSNEEAHRRNEIDVHAASFIRVNLTLAQFDEFKTFYSITGRDNMYIDEEDVIAIW